MPESTRKVFVSCTVEDLREHAEAVLDAARQEGWLADYHKDWPATGGLPVDECLRRARSCHALVVLVAHRYGWVPGKAEGGDGKTSITWMEVRAADAENGVAVVPFVLPDSVPWPPNMMEGLQDPQAAERLARFKAELNARHRGEFGAEPGSVVEPVRDSLREIGRRLDAAAKKKSAAAAGAVSGGAAEAPDETGARELDRARFAPYLAKVASLHESLPVVGFETKVRVPLKLDDLYVPLRARADLRVTGGVGFGEAEEADRELGRHGESDLPLSEAFARAHELGERRGLVILGDPGAGKTTFLRQLALCLARGRHAEVGLDDDLLPVFLPLRDLKDVDAGLTAFMEAQLRQPELGLDEDLARRLVERGRLLVLLDGLDEVPKLGDRGTVADWIDDALRKMPDSRFVVTSRYAGYTDEARLSEQFLELHVRPLSKEGADAFVHNWFRVVETTLATDKSQARLKAEAAADALVDRLNQRDFKARRVFELTRNPLLLTIICLVHRDRGSLPHRRERLYAESINVLLERWRVAKRLPVAADAETTRRVLQPAALWMHRNGVRRATARELIPILDPALTAVQWTKGDARSFLETIRNESGLLTGWSDKTYGFLHLGFQEYLAAREIRRLHFEGDSSGLDEVARTFGDSWWREVLLLLLSLEEPSLFEPVMERVVQTRMFGPEVELVAECLDDTREFSAKPFVDLIVQYAETDDASHRKIQAMRVLTARAPGEAERLSPVRLSSESRIVSAHGKMSVETDQPVGETPVGEQREIETTVADQGGYVLVRVPGGRFLMGSPNEEFGRFEREGPQHAVELPTFELGRCPVSNEEYGRFLEATGHVEPSEWGNRRFNQPDQPVVGVSWYDARAYCNWAGLVLPSEAMWEYSCRAGTTTPFYWGETITTDQANYDGNHPYAGGEKGEYRERTVPVLELGANAWGLHQMHGNVWEWCEDTYQDSYEGARTDGRAWTKEGSEYRVIRGGGWSNDARGARSAFRGGGHAGVRVTYLGFRPARFAAD